MRLFRASPPCLRPRLAAATAQHDFLSLGESLAGEGEGRPRRSRSFQSSCQCTVVSLTGWGTFVGDSRGQEALLAGLDLHGEILRIDAALREAAGNEPKPGLRRAHEHVAQFLPVTEAPYRSHARGDGFAEQLLH